MSTSEREKKSNSAYYQKHKGYYARYGRRYYKKNRARMLQQNKDSRQRAKDEAFQAYGGYVCYCCGETIQKFLTLDHINNGGNAHRRKLMPKGWSGYTIYFWLRRNGYPPIMQVACYNCNCGRAKNGGICPHVSLPA